MSIWRSASLLLRLPPTATWQKRRGRNLAALDQDEPLSPYGRGARQDRICLPPPIFGELGNQHQNLRVAHDDLVEVLSGKSQQRGPPKRGDCGGGGSLLQQRHLAENLALAKMG